MMVYFVCVCVCAWCSKLSVLVPLSKLRSAVQRLCMAEVDGSSRVLQVPFFQKVIESVLVLFKFNRDWSIVDLVGALVFLIVSDFFFVRDKAIEGDTCGTLFHAPHRMPKVGSDGGVVIGIVPTVVGS